MAEWFSKPKYIAIAVLALAAIAIVAKESIGNQEPAALVQDRYVQQMTELEKHAIAIGDDRLAQHIHCEYEPPKQDSEQAKCKALAEHYAHEAAPIKLSH